MEAADTSLIALVSNAIEGEETAFKELYNLFSSTMFNICIRMTGNRQEAEDIVQESFIKAFESLRQLKDGRMFGGWLRKIVINNCIRHIKRRTDLRQLSAAGDIADDNDAEWLKQTANAALHNSIKNLPEGCRQIFLLYASEDYTHKEIGVLLSISESTSKSQYLRAKKLLKEQLTGDNG